MRKPALVLVPLTLLFTLIHFSCSKVVKSDAYYQAISRYVYAYTSGAIGRSDAIRVRFVDPVVGADKVGQNV